MPKSRNRKEHKKKVAIRNQRIRGQQNKFQREYTKMVEDQIELLKEKFSGVTEENININVDGSEVPFEIVTPEE
jgi:hypothetical protein